MNNVRRDGRNCGWRLIPKSFVLCSASGPLLSKVNGNIAIDFLAVHSYFRQLSHVKFQSKILLTTQWPRNHKHDGPIEKKKKNYLNFSIAGRSLISGELRKRGFVLNLYCPGLFPNHNIRKLMQILAHTQCVKLVLALSLPGCQRDDLQKQW